MQENEMIALVLVNVERAEHDLPPCALTDLTDTDLKRYLSRATAVQTAIRAATLSNEVE